MLNPLNEIKHWSPSSLSLLNDCPDAWWAKYIEKRAAPPTEAASFGRDFGTAIARELGATVHADSPAAKDADRDPLPEALDAARWYLKQPGAPVKSAGIVAEHPVRITAERWNQILEHYDLPAMKNELPIIGYADLFGAELGLIENKTSKRAETRPGWIDQVLLYNIGLGWTGKTELHLLVRRAKGWELRRYNVGISEPAFVYVLRWYTFLMDRGWALVNAKAHERVSCARPGFYCSWCDKQFDCGAFAAANLVPIE